MATRQGILWASFTRPAPWQALSVPSRACIRRALQVRGMMLTVDTGIRGSKRLCFARSHLAVMQTWGPAGAKATSLCGPHARLAQGQPSLCTLSCPFTSGATEAHVSKGSLSRDERSRTQPISDTPHVNLAQWVEEIPDKGLLVQSHDFP